MQLSNEFFARIIGAFIGSVIAAYIGARLAVWLDVTEQLSAYILIFGLLGFLIGLILTPIFTVRPMRRIRGALAGMPVERLVAIIGGIFLGLVAASLLTLPLSTLPNPLSSDRTHCRRNCALLPERCHTDASPKRFAHFPEFPAFKSFTSK
jgi:uncharacterized protein YacL